MVHLFIPFLSLLLLPGVGASVHAQSTDGRSARIELVTITAPESVAARTVGHFRVQVTETTTQPVNYLWDLGDGTLSMGSPISHAYARPGRYEVTVVARNAGGRDTLRTTVKVGPPDTTGTQEAAESAVETTAAVSPARAEPSASVGRPTNPVRISRSALYGSGGIVPAQGGFTWVIGSDLWAERARNLALRYRLQGLRADLLVDTSGVGSPAYRVVVGQFATREEAVAVRQWVPETGTAWLLAVDSTLSSTNEP